MAEMARGGVREGAQVITGPSVCDAFPVEQEKPERNKEIDGFFEVVVQAAEKGPQDLGRDGVAPFMRIGRESLQELVAQGADSEDLDPGDYCFGLLCLAKYARVANFYTPGEKKLISPNDLEKVSSVGADLFLKFSERLFPDAVIEEYSKEIRSEIVNELVEALDALKLRPMDSREYSVALGTVGDINSQELLANIRNIYSLQIGLVFDEVVSSLGLGADSTSSLDPQNYVERSNPTVVAKFVRAFYKLKQLEAMVLPSAAYADEG